MILIKILIKLKPLIILALFLVFLLIFGLPAYRSFTNYDVFIKESKILPKPLPAPAMTICFEPVSTN